MLSVIDTTPIPTWWSDSYRDCEHASNTIKSSEVVCSC